ncbi:hypothetical protein Q1695_013432 [Nippostrongylus brasiliensis]|nr:hypothetical protein Q1695_013432 [Nippostrongylus brasiliensis]
MIRYITFATCSLIITFSQARHLRKIDENAPLKEEVYNEVLELLETADGMEALQLGVEESLSQVNHTFSGTTFACIANSSSPVEKEFQRIYEIMHKDISGLSGAAEKFIHNLKRSLREQMYEAVTPIIIGRIKNAIHFNRLSQEVKMELEKYFPETVKTLNYQLEVLRNADQEDSEIDA